MLLVSFRVRLALGSVLLLGFLSVADVRAGVQGVGPGAFSAGEQRVPGDSALASASAVRAALLYGMHGSGRKKALAEGPRSVPLALGLSVVVPGLGQAYNRQWIKAAAGVAIEAALITGYFVWRDRGLEGEAAYIDYAHRHWSAAKYAQWLGDYTAYLPGLDRAEIAVPDVDFATPEAWTPQERADVRDFFAEIRAVERQTYNIGTGASFSHVLPYFAEQQYYELIGKYYQFAPGWNDYAPWLDEDGNPIPDVIDPARRGADGGRPNIQGRFDEYRRDHAEANNLLRRASRASALVLANHFFAALDAAISAKLHNNRLDADVQLGYDLDGRPQPTASLRLRF